MKLIVRALARTWAWLRARPVTVALATVILAVALVRPIFGRASETLPWLALSANHVLDSGRVWTLATYSLAAVGPRAVILSIIATLVFVGLVEPRLGHWRTLLAWVATSVLAGLGMVLALLGLSPLDFSWLPDAYTVSIATPLAGVAGTLLAGSATLGAVSRRRVRLLGALALVLMVIAFGRLPDVATALAGLIGYLGGLLIAGRPTERQWRRSGAAETRELLGGGLAVLGLVPILALLQPNRHSLAGPFTEFIAQLAGAYAARHHCWSASTGANVLCTETPVASLTPTELLISMLPCLLFLVAAWGVWRGMRVAAWLGIGLLLVTAALTAFYWFVAPLLAGRQGVWGPRVDASAFQLQAAGAVLLALAAAFCLWRWRSTCTRLPERRQVLRSALVVLASAVLLMAVYAGFVLADPTAWDPEPEVWAVLADAPERLLPVAMLIATPEEFEPLTPLAGFVSGAIAPLFHLITLVTGIRLVASGSSTAKAMPRPELLELLRKGGGTSLSYMATWPGMRHWVDDVSGAVVPYRLERGVAIVLARPFGAPDEAPVPIIERFAHDADSRGWTPCVYAAPNADVEAYHELGWDTVEVGEESVIDPQAWSMQGKKWQNVRTSINRAKREGVEVRWTRYDELTVAEARALRDMSTEWVGEKDLPEMGFTLGGLAELEDDEVMLVLALDPDGRIEAATSWLPTWRHGERIGWTLDFMRRRPDGMNGVMEMLVAVVAERLQEEGAEFMSLSTAPLAASVVPAAGAEGAVLDRLLADLGRRLEPVYGFRSLLRFKQKFQPSMEPVVLAYHDPITLPAIGSALTEAYLPGVSIGRLAGAFLGSPKEDKSAPPAATAPSPAPKAAPGGASAAGASAQKGEPPAPPVVS